ncbi:MAG: LptF/LptG family permease [Alphaproteobacteria bacterium]
MARQFVTGLILILAIMTTVLLISTSLEISRIYQSKSLELASYLKLILFKLPFLIEEIIPFIFLLASIFTLVRLTKSNELVVAKAAGISVWQFLLPLILIAILFGIFIVTIFNPFSTTLLEKFDRLTNKYSNKSYNSIVIDDNGIWLTDKTLDNNIIIHSKSFNQNQSLLKTAIFYLFDKNGKFLQRLDATEAKLENNTWTLYNINILNDREITYKTANIMNIPTSIKISKLQDNFASPKKISFWNLFAFIRTLKMTGFSGVKYHIHLYKLVILPIYLASMVILAAVFSLRSYFFQRKNFSIVIGISSGFIIYFMFDIIAAFGLSGKLYPSISVFVPVFILLLISVAALIHLENG